MKKKSLMTILILTSLSLAACQSGTETASTSSSQTSQTQTTSQQSTTASKTTTSQTTAASTSTVSTEATSTTTVTPAPDTTVAVPSDQLDVTYDLLAQMAGTWTGSSPQATKISLTIGADGSFTVTQNFDGNEVTETAFVSQIIQVAPNTFVFSKEEGSAHALLPGVTGLGGMGTWSQIGFRLENGQYVPLVWFALTGQPMDYTNPNDFGTRLSRE